MKKEIGKMGWKDWSYVKKSIIVSLIIVVLAFTPFLETSTRNNKCEPIPNLGGPNYPYCLTMIFSLFLLPGFIIATVLLGIDLTARHWIFIGFLSFIIYFLIGYLYTKLKNKTKGEKQQ